MAQATQTRLHRLFKLNMVIGVVIFLITTYLTLTGEYDSLLLRKQAESLFNVIGISGLLYAALFWYLNAFYKPEKIPTSNPQCGQ